MMRVSTAPNQGKVVPPILVQQPPKESNAAKSSTPITPWWCTKGTCEKQM